MRSRKTKTPPIRVGDTVRVVTPEAVVRVGYPLAFETVVEAVRKERLADIEAFLDRMGVRFEPYGVPRAVDRVVKALAYERMRQAGFGGKSRTIHTHALPERAGQTCRVLAVRFVKTGERGMAYDGDDCYRPYLANEQTHRLLELDAPGWSDDRDFWRPFEIDAANVQLVGLAVE